jgi:hypothetical protein
MLTGCHPASLCFDRADGFVSTTACQIEKKAAVRQVRSSISEKMRNEFRLSPALRARNELLQTEPIYLVSESGALARLQACDLERQGLNNVIIDLLALFAARWSGIQKLPDLWIVMLMLNPLDSFRIDALFALQQIPAEAANKTPLAGWWTAHAGAWFAGIAVVWSAMMMTLASLRLNRWGE